MKRVLYRPIAILASVISITACGMHRGCSVDPPIPNGLTCQERADGWRLLFDGKTLNGWRDYHADTISKAWSVIDGVMTKTKGTEDIVTRESFGDFELAFDWQLSLEGNSGVFTRATEEYSKIYWSAVEFQLLDDSLASDNKDSTHLAGAAYGFYAPPRGVAHVGGNWNSSKIIAKGSHIEYWMNGRKTIEYEVWTPQWQAMVAKTKFRPYPNFGLAKSGLIGIQGDHPGSLQLRNIKIRVLK